MGKMMTVPEEFRELERLRDRTSHNEAAALQHARQEAKAQERVKWQTVVASKDAAFAKQATLIADKDTLIAELQARLGNG